MLGSGLISHWVWTSRPAFQSPRGETVFASSAAFTLGVLLDYSPSPRETPQFTVATIWFRWAAHCMPGHE